MDLTLDNWPRHLFAARRAYMHHCLMALGWLCMCAIFYVHYTTYMPPMESPYSSVLIWYFYVHCNLALFGSEAQGSICEICPTNLASFLGFLGFFMDLLVQDSIWIYLFSLWPYGPIHSLWWWNLYSEGGTLHYTSLSLTVIVLHCWTKPPRPKGSAGAVCWLGVFSVWDGNNRQLQQHQVKVLFLLWKLGIHPSSLLLIYCYLLLWHLLSI